jgi:hypothetical protein
MLIPVGSVVYFKEGPHAFHSGYIVSERHGLYEIRLDSLRYPITVWAYELEISVVAARYGDDYRIT